MRINFDNILTLSSYDDIIELKKLTPKILFLIL